MDHIQQAADITLLDRNAFDHTEASFLRQGKEAGDALKRGLKDRGPCLCILYIEDPAELSMEGFNSLAWEGCHYLLAVKPGLGPSAAKRFPDLAQSGDLVEFDPARERLGGLVCGHPTLGPFLLAKAPRMTIIAPFFFLELQGLEPEIWRGAGGRSEVRFLANNYTVQGVKIKRCKAILNRVFCYLALLDREPREACPFLGEREGILTVDMGFIPERYRLDLDRAQEILVRCIGKYLEGLEGRLHG